MSSFGALLWETNDKKMTFIHIFRQETTIADWNGVCEWKQACCRAIATEQNGCWQHVESLQRRTYPPRALLGWLVKEPSFKEAQVCNNACRKCKTLLLIRFITCWNMSKTVEQVQSWPSYFGKDSNIPVKNKHPFAAPVYLRLTSVHIFVSSPGSPLWKFSRQSCSVFVSCSFSWPFPSLSPSPSVPRLLSKKDETNFSASAGDKLLLIIPRFLKGASFFPALPRDQSLDRYVELGGKCQWGFDNDSRYSFLHCYLIKRGASPLPPRCCWGDFDLGDAPWWRRWSWITRTLQTAEHTPPLRGCALPVITCKDPPSHCARSL